jgi:hypothetical protein
VLLHYPYQRKIERRERPLVCIIPSKPVLAISNLEIILPLACVIKILILKQQFYVNDHAQIYRVDKEHLYNIFFPFASIYDPNTVII